MAQPAEARIARSEIVDGQHHALFLQLRERLFGPGLVLHDHRFGDFEFEHRSVDSGFLDDGGHQLRKILEHELLARDVDRHPRHRQSLVYPALGLPAGAAQHPFADAQDQAGLLGHRNELGRGHDAQLVVGPTQQRLHAGNPARAHVELRLIVQGELAALQGAA